jgi:hypothetical protein
MTKTYEVHHHLRDTDENDDVIVELQQEEIQNLSWWRRLFLPRYPHFGDVVDEEDINDIDQTKNPVDPEARNRFYSADVTVATNYSSPPTTPDGNNGIASEVEIPSYRKICSDLETTIEYDIPSIGEDIEDNGFSEGRGRSILTGDLPPSGETHLSSTL